MSLRHGELDTMTIFKHIGPFHGFSCPPCALAGQALSGLSEGFSRLQIYRFSLFFLNPRCRFIIRRIITVIQ